MYNRYIRGENGAFSRIPQEEQSTTTAETPPLPQKRAAPPPSSFAASPESEPQRPDGLTNFLQHILDRFHLDQIDTGDLILLALLFYLFRQEADEELLVALGLLLIL